MIKSIAYRCGASRGFRSPLDAARLRSTVPAGIEPITAMKFPFRAQVLIRTLGLVRVTCRCRGQGQRCVVFHSFDIVHGFLQALQMDTCARCRRQDQLKLCSRCRTVKYCSKECQISGWKAHKAKCRKDRRPPADLLACQQDTAHKSQANVQRDGVGNVPVPTCQITSLYMSKVDMSLRDGRWLQYFSDRVGLSELDLSRYIGNEEGERLDKRPFSLSMARHFTSYAAR